MMDDATLAAFRFGYGLPLPDGAPTGADGILARLAGPDIAATTWPGLGMAEALPLQAASDEARRARRTRDEARAEYRAGIKAVTRQSNQAILVTFARAVGASDGFRERLVRFWADHFTTVPKRQQDRGLVLAMIEDAIRPNLTGRFGDLLKAATLHPAMVLYLDQQLSVGPNSPKAQNSKRGLNENLARELLELHTLGVGADYTQDDVRQMAELLTGLIFRVGDGADFLSRAAEPGPETVLGRVYEGDGIAPILAALDDLALRPETGRHLSRKLAVHFVSDTPDPDLVSQMERAYSDSKGDLMSVYAVLLAHPAAWVPELTKARQPFDFMTASLRALGIGPSQIGQMTGQTLQKRLLDPMATMGQPMNAAPGPDGWPEDAKAWINPQGLAARITWAMEMPSRMLEVLPEPARLAQAALGPLVSEPLQFAVRGAENRREGVGLVLASAEFNLR